MKINEYQEKAHEFSFYSVPSFVKQHGSIVHERKCSFVYPVMGLAEEAGEVSGKFAKIIRDKEGVISDEDRDAISKELGDVCWMIAEICTVLDLNLEDVMQQNIDKLTDRRNRKVLSGSGDNR